MSNQLATKVEGGGRVASGYCTPMEDRIPQKMSVPPKRVLPIIFLPGIMGSNLRMTAERQTLLSYSNNVAWRPDDLSEGTALLRATAADRQLQLDPDTTEVDIYEPGGSTGDRSVTAGRRHTINNVDVHLNVGVNTPLLTDDPVTDGRRHTKEMKARERGWSEIYFDSYHRILELCEESLNTPLAYGHWREILGVNPKVWGASPTPELQPLSFEELKRAVAGCWFPVHAMGYNWLKSNRDSAVEVAGRIRALIKKYSQNYACEKVIIVTHSMGGLVGRALIHPEMGALESEVLGIVHGAMPAIGAPAAYKRMRCGFEEGVLGVSIAAKVLGNYGSEVTAVLGNARGGLELLPSKAYGNGWLEIRKDDTILQRLPAHGDPYAEIYQLRGKWFGLLKEEWLNPAGLADRGFEHTCALLQLAKAFHESINSTYHSRSYGHYSAENARASWSSISWDLDKKYRGNDWQNLNITTDSGQGKFEVRDSGGTTETNVWHVSLGPSIGPGDQTVPLRSAEHQLLSGKFSGVFRQVGYEHQNSYQDPNALKSTLYSLVRIIENMTWCKHA
ncbi:hypothetical protein GTP91_26790 [Rugamonas sp. FT82W]|uniref:PGAP1-like protein n=1 Tax=Duganella vulcania TaxID=2692166 RepID=A0A845GD30_9BURK|nr:hypothetical protein [Duganella vulcania]MYM90767.1 hypothetical protein [Duganella vulcania]